MGANLCSIRRPATANASDDGYVICGWRSWRRRWWRRARREVKRDRSLEASIEKKEMKNEYMSLEELLLASPGFSDGGFKRKVHPTRISQCPSVCERSSLVGESIVEDEYSHGGSSICRSSQSGKLKKKVSFRLPEVSDIIVIPSSEDDVTTDDDGNVASEFMVTKTIDAHSKLCS